MGDFLLNERQMARIKPYFLLAHGLPPVDDRRVVSGIVFVIPTQWLPMKKGAQFGYRPAQDTLQTLYPLESDRCLRPHLLRPASE